MANGAPLWQPARATGVETSASLDACPFVNQFTNSERLVLIKSYAIDVSSGTGIYSVGDGSAAYSEVGTSGLGGIQLATGDFVTNYWRLPVDIDTSEAIGFQYIYSHSSTAGGTFIGTGLYTAGVVGTTVVGSDPSTALDTVFTSQTPLAANILKEGPWGYIAASTSAVVALRPGRDGLLLRVSFTPTGCGTITLNSIWARYKARYVA